MARLRRQQPMPSVAVQHCAPRVLLFTAPDNLAPRLGCIARSSNAKIESKSQINVPNNAPWP